MTVDYEYLTRSIAQLSGIPVRVYQNGEEQFRSFPVTLPRDPMNVYRESIFAITEHVGYYATPLFHYYGVLNTGDRKIIIGPTAQIMADEQKLKELAFQADVPKDEVPVFVEGMKAIMHLPPETLLQMLCTMNHFLNQGEILELEDLAIHEEEQVLLKTGIEQQRSSRVFEYEVPDQKPHNTFSIEETLMRIVCRGDTAALRQWLSSAPAVQSGTIAGDQLRQLRNLFMNVFSLFMVCF